MSELRGSGYSPEEYDHTIAKMAKCGAYLGEGGFRWRYSNERVREKELPLTMQPRFGLLLRRFLYSLRV